MMRLLKIERRDCGDCRSYRITLDVDGEEVSKSILLGDNKFKELSVLRRLNEARRDGLFKIHGENWREHDPHNFFDMEWVDESVKKTLSDIRAAYPEEFQGIH